MKISLSRGVTCPKCSGAKTLVATNLAPGGKKLVAIKCFYCRGKGKLGRR